MEIASSSNPPPLERDGMAGNGSCSSSSASNGPIPGPNPRSNENNPYPTTFVQADTATFKQVVQMLTGSTSKTGGGGGIPPIRSTGQKKQGFKLYERRSNLKSGLMIDTPGPGFSPRKPELLSPSILDFPSLALSPATNDRRGGDTLLLQGKAEDAAIAGKKFYFHPPSPRTGGEPQLLALFPVTSPRVSGSS